MDVLTINPGDLRTKIRIQKRETSRQPGEIASKTEWIDIGNTSGADLPRYKRCQWIGAHGDETFSDDALQGTHFATIRLRYDPRINETCRVLLGGDAWEITSLDDVRQLHRWVEIKLKRKAAG